MSTRDQRAVDALLPASFDGTVLLARFALHQARHNSDSFRLESGDIASPNVVLT